MWRLGPRMHETDRANMAVVELIDNPYDMRKVFEMFAQYTEQREKQLAQRNKKLPLARKKKAAAAQQEPKDDTITKVVDTISDESVAASKRSDTTSRQEAATAATTTTTTTITSSSSITAHDSTAAPKRKSIWERALSLVKGK